MANMRIEKNLNKLQRLNLEIILTTRKLQELKEQRHRISKMFRPNVYEQELERLKKEYELLENSAESLSS